MPSRRTLSVLEGSNHGGADLGRAGSGNRAGPAPRSSGWKHPRAGRRPLRSLRFRPRRQPSGRLRPERRAGRRPCTRRDFGPSGAGGLRTTSGGFVLRTRGLRITRRWVACDSADRVACDSGSPSEAFAGWARVTARVRQTIVLAGGRRDFGLVTAGSDRRSRGFPREKASAGSREGCRTRVCAASPPTEDRHGFPPAGAFGTCAGNTARKGVRGFGPGAAGRAGGCPHEHLQKADGRARPQGEGARPEARIPERVDAQAETPSGFPFSRGRLSRSRPAARAT